MNDDHNDIQYNINSDESKKIDIRMNKIIDWRQYFDNPDSITIQGEPITRTDYIHNKKVSEKFYKLHPMDYNNYIDDKKNAVVLDLGCGQALGMEKIINFCKEYHGVDLSIEQLNLARTYFPKQIYPHMQLYYDTVFTKYFPDNFADFIISSEVIEHLDNPFEHIRYCNKKLKPGGILSLSTPNISIYWYPLMTLYTLVNYPGKWHKMLNAHKYWKEAITWHPSLRPIVLRKMLEKKGFEILDHYTCTWFWYDHVCMRLTRMLEKKGLKMHIQIFKIWINMLELLIETNLPVLKWAGIRQFIVAQKK